LEARLEGRPRVLLLRPPGSSPGPLAEVAVVAHIPVVDLEPVPGAVERLAAELRRGAEWLVLTSPRAPAMLGPVLGLVAELQRGGRLRIAVVGAKTREALERLGLRVDLQPPSFRGADLARELAGLRPGRVVLARSEQGVPDLPRILSQAGVEVVEVPLYRVVELEDMAEAAARVADLFDYVVFTSPSIAESFTRRYPRPRSPGFTPVAIGPTTAEKLAELGYPPPLQPGRYTLDDVARLILEHWGRRGNS